MSSQNNRILLDSFFFEHPSTILLSGPSKSGKTTLLSKILFYCDKGLVQPPPDRIIYCYSVWQKAFEEIQINLITWFKNYANKADHFVLFSLIINLVNVNKTTKKLFVSNLLE